MIGAVLFRIRISVNSYVAKLGNLKQVDLTKRPKTQCPNLVKKIQKRQTLGETV